MVKPAASIYPCAKSALSEGLVRGGPTRTQLALVAAAFFLEVLDATIMPPAIPSVARDLGANIGIVTLSLAGFGLGLALFTPVGGRWMRCNDLRRIFLNGVLIFGMGIMAGALASNVYLLAAARFIQGVGAAMLVPAGRTIILRATPRETIAAMMAWLVGPALMAPVIAPVLSAVMLTQGSWRGIFWLFLPCSVAIYVTGWTCLPRGIRAWSVHSAPFDRTGCAYWYLSVCGAFALFASIGYRAPLAIVGTTVCTVLSVIGLVRHLRICRADALFDRTLLKLPFYRANVSAGSAFRVAIYAFPTVFTLYLIDGRGYVPMIPALCLASLFAGNILAKPLAVVVMRIWPDGRSYLTAAALMHAGAFAIFFIPALYAHLPMLFLLCALYGSTRSFLFLGLSTLALSNVSAPRMHAANTMSASAMQLNVMVAQALPAMLAMLFSPNAIEGDVTVAATFYLASLAIIMALSLITLFGVANIRKGRIRKWNRK